MKDNIILDDIPMRVKDVREYLGLSRDKTYALFHEADFPCVRLGRDMFIMKSDLLRWIQNHRYTNVDLVA